jgi:uncharacterized protein YyaL (SSP411 family)
VNVLSNYLINQSSPYLLQHSENPVEWYPWCKEAFARAKKEDKPIFLSIGYSTCHWCHVMAHESFEDQEIADILNKNFVSIKVDKEERPDIDSIYMAVCQAFTGSGGWPTSIIMTAEQKPFFAGTYLPKISRYGMIGLRELLLTVQEKWQNDRGTLLRSANQITKILNKNQIQWSKADEKILYDAVELYEKGYDETFGGFGDAPKFPSPHNLLFLMKHYKNTGHREALEMAEKTLVQMYKGGMFDHIGYGFCRYSTDPYFLVPHFEKMLYDNALLILAFCMAYEITENPFYKDVSEKIAFYILTEMTSKEGGFFSAQDADSQGVEGKYYVFEPHEIIKLLGEKEGESFNSYYDITEKGNFDGKSIPNLLHNKGFKDNFDEFLPKIREYRFKRCSLHTDDKILTAWNSLMIAALCRLYKVSGDEDYLYAAKKAQRFIESELCENNTLFVSFRKGRHGDKGFLDDYAFYTYGLLSLYDVTLDSNFLNRAKEIGCKAIDDFYDMKNGGFYLYGKENETLIFRPKEKYDGAMPSGNSMMAYNLVRMNYLNSSEKIEGILETQLKFMCGEAEKYPTGYGMFLVALSDYFYPPLMITVVLKEKESLKQLPFSLPYDSIIKVLEKPTEEFPLLNDKTTYYVCRNHSCMQPTNTLEF